MDDEDDGYTYTYTYSQSYSDSELPDSFSRPVAMENVTFGDRLVEVLDEDDDARSYVFESESEQEATIRENIFLLFDDPSSSPQAMALAICVLALIVISTVVFTVGTLPQFIESNNTILVAIEYVCVSAFTLEYLVKFITVKHRWRFFKGPFNLIDLLSVVPFYIELLLQNQSGGSLAVIRVVRLTRVFRLFKLGKYSSGFAMVSKAFVVSLEQLGLLFFLLVIAVIFFSSLIYYAELLSSRWDPSINRWIRDGETTPSPFQSISASYWWAIVTMTTVGYGDHVPISFTGKIIGAVTVVSGILILAFPITVIGANFASAWAETKEEEKSQRVKDVVAVDTTLQHLVQLLDQEYKMLQSNIDVFEDAFSVVASKQTNASHVLQAVQKELTVYTAAQGETVIGHEAFVFESLDPDLQAKLKKIAVLNPEKKEEKPVTAPKKRKRARRSSPSHPPA